MQELFSKIRRNAFLKPGYIIVISVFIILLMILSAYFELKENKREIYHLLDEYSLSMLNTIEKSSENTVISDIEIENLLAQHLLGVARNVVRLDSLNLINNDILKKISEENEVYRINVFDNNLNRIYTNSDVPHKPEEGKGKYSPSDYLSKIIDGSENEIIIGLKKARMEEGSRFAVAVRRAINKKGAVVVNLDAESFLEFRKKIGFGKMLLDIGGGTGLEYIMLQDSVKVIAADKNVDELGSVSDDEFLKKVYSDTVHHTRIFNFEGRKVYEIAKPFVVENNKVGIFRIGLSMDEVISVENRMLRRAVIISIIVAVISVIVITFVISGQNLKIMTEEYGRIKTFTGNILENMSHGVISVDGEGKILIFNKASSELLNVDCDSASGMNAEKLLASYPEIAEIFSDRKILKNSEIKSCGKIFNINTIEIRKSDNSLDSFTLVLEDKTESKFLENQIQQNEKLIAMGELASGVAHEIRNPLNSINLIAQLLEREYSAKINSDDFSKLTDVLRKESMRVNDIIEQFLKFARPPKLNITEISTTELVNDISNIAKVQTEAKSIKFISEVKTDKIIRIDIPLIKQVFLNLLRNSIEAVDTNGEIRLVYDYIKGKNVFEFSDNGHGISKDNLNKIFDLYYTTKSTGTGMGLSIARQIIMQHGGAMDVESKEGSGTKFKIIL